MEIDLNHRFKDVNYIESPNQGGPFAPELPDTIVIHYTAGANAESAIYTLCDRKRKVSAHLVVGRDGAVTQLLPFNIVGWHAGRSLWRERTSLNQYSIGIEIDNAGQLSERDGRYESWFGQTYPASEVVRDAHRNQSLPGAHPQIRQPVSFWHRYTEVQFEVVETICAALIAAYGIYHILGHEEIAPDRKVDPGPAFPLDEMRARLLTIA